MYVIDIVVWDPLLLQLLHLRKLLLMPLHVILVFLDQVIHGQILALVLDPSLLVENSLFILFELLAGFLLFAEGHFLLDIQVSSGSWRGLDAVFQVVGY
jgi:hypothetical protein